MRRCKWGGVRAKRRRGASRGGEAHQQAEGHGVGDDELEADLIGTMSSALPAYRQSAQGANVCSGYEDLRLDADLNRENELVDFFTRVMERRKENKWD